MGIADNSIIRRMGLFAALFGRNSRDLYSVYGYTAAPTYKDKLVKYLRQDVAGRVVDAPAAALWSNPPEIKANSDDWNTLWKDLETKFNIYAFLEKVDKLAGIGQYSILLVGFNDGSKLEQPVNTRSLTQKKDKILFFQPFSEISCKVKAYNKDTSSEDFNKPLMYTVYPNMDETLAVNGFTGSNSKGLAGAFDVHASRILHIAENTLENDVYGCPRIERVYNLLDDLIKVVGGSAETYWLTANRGLHIDLDKEMDMDPTDAKNLSDEVDEYSNQLRRIIRTRGAKITNLGSDVPDPKNTFGVIIASISGATGIPQRILIGSEAGQLASEQDRANWADRIDERRTLWANPLVLFKLIKLLTRAGYLPTPDALEVTVTWPSAFKMSPLESAQTAAQHARSATNFAKVFDVFHNLNKSTPATADTTSPDGTVIPGTPEQVGAGLQPLLEIDEARKFIGLDKPKVTFDSSEDIK